MHYFVKWSNKVWLISQLLYLEAHFSDFYQIDFVAIKVESEIEYPFVPARIDEEQKREKLTVNIDTSKVNFNDLMGRIRHHVLVHRIRVRYE